MPRFLWTIAILDTLLLAAIGYIVKNTSPDQPKNIAIFFIFFWGFLTLFLSIPLYLINHRLAPRLTQLKAIYRKSLKISVIVATFITGIAIFKASDLLTPVNSLLLAVFVAAVYKFLSRAS